MFKFKYILLISAPLLGACAGPVIADLEGDKVIVRGNQGTQAEIFAEAQRGCSIHDKGAIPISSSCADGNCWVRNYLFACKGPTKVELGSQSAFSQSTPVAKQEKPAERPVAVQPASANQQPKVAPPVNYTEEEIAFYCQQDWKVRTLNTGEVEVNPCLTKRQ
ncbi:hypothetical protein KHP62_09325 [Rhodobacteraceae bacterium NNCM2]|nr:hypothetical protein [Coraliihabitans acroporae]